MGRKRANRTGRSTMGAVPSAPSGVAPQPQETRGKWTESQKFIANIVIAGGLSLVVGAWLLRSEQRLKYAEAAASLERDRVSFLHQQLETFADATMRSIDANYERSKYFLMCLQRPQSCDLSEACTFVDASGSEHTYPNPACEKGSPMTWGELRAAMLEWESRTLALPHPTVLCRRLQMYLRSPQAIEAAERFRASLTVLCDPEAIDNQSDLDRRLARVNGEFDELMSALRYEFSNP